MTAHVWGGIAEVGILQIFELHFRGLLSSFFSEAFAELAADIRSVVALFSTTSKTKDLCG
jgi:hypothetical protein